MKKRVTQDSGYSEILGMKALSHASLGVIREVLGVMAPKGSIVVPEVVVWIIGEADSQNRLAA